MRSKKDDLWARSHDEYFIKTTVFWQTLVVVLFIIGVVWDTYYPCAIAGILQALLVNKMIDK